MFFSGYGELSQITAKQYFSEPWKYLCSEKGVDGVLYDIVIQGDYPCNLAYTLIEGD